jgi:hypothetical protein
MKKILNEAFTITLAIFIILGIVTVADQAFGIITGNKDLAVYISKTVQKYAITFSGICAVISFIYLMFSEDAFKKVED